MASLPIINGTDQQEANQRYHRLGLRWSAFELSWNVCTNLSPNVLNRTSPSVPIGLSRKSYRINAVVHVYCNTMRSRHATCMVSIGPVGKKIENCLTRCGTNMAGEPCRSWTNHWWHANCCIRLVTNWSVSRRCQLDSSIIAWKTFEAMGFRSIKWSVRAIFTMISIAIRRKKRSKDWIRWCSSMIWDETFAISRMLKQNWSSLIVSATMIRAMVKTSSIMRSTQLCWISCETSFVMRKNTVQQSNGTRNLLNRPISFFFFWVKRCFKNNKKKYNVSV